MSKLVNNLIRKGFIKSDLIIEAFSEISRVEFIQERFQKQADVDIILSIGYGQNILQPSIMAIMLELLDLKRDQSVLDIGCGSGWSTVLLAYIVGKHGHVVAMDCIPELVQLAKENVGKYSFVSRNNIVSFETGDGYDGFSQSSPYDRILVSAASDDVPQSLKNQLKIGGKMVLPVHNTLWLLEKESETEFHKEEYRGFVFTPFVRQS